MVRFTQDQYTGSEATGFVQVNLELIGGAFPDTFSVTVIVSEKSPVSAKGNCIAYITMYVFTEGLTNRWC